jgi:phospholipid/cholesterol/gamma-HCH transport system substrate-binding protein
MAKESFAAVVRRRLLGLLLIGVVVGLVTLSIAIYNKAFSTYVEVTLRADHTGNQLIVDSDVKERGIIVGSVKSVTSNGDGAIVKLDLDPGRVKDIPKDVKAQILPKTLFGEQYVSLIVPSDATVGENSIKANDVIPQDRSKGALETEKVLGDLLPVLTAVHPAELNATLTALATALHDRGDELGRTLVNFDQYLKVINPHTKKIVDDLVKLGQVSLEYNDAAPDILATLSNLETSARTVVQKRVQLDDLLHNCATASSVLQSFLADNQQRLIAITGQTDKVYALLAEYSPEFSCMFNGVAKLADRTSKIFYNNQVHLQVRMNPHNMGAYRPGQEPKLITGFGPNCFGLPNNPGPIDSLGNAQIPDKYKCINDGAPLTAEAASPNCKASTASATDRSSGSAAENALVRTLIAGDLNTTPDKVPDAATLLAAPLLRGQQVVVK